MGGTLFYDTSERDGFVGTRYVKFNGEKFKAYSIDGKGDERGGTLKIYSTHNVDFYPGALFLRNWAILYLNEAMRSLGENLLRET